MIVRKTRNGWVVEITNSINDMLEQGGICGGEVLFYRRTLKALGIDYNADPEACAGCVDPSVTHLDYLLHCVDPDRVLKAGHII